MNISKYAEHPNYNPTALLDAVALKLGAKNDAALARALDLTPPQISKMRGGTNGISGDMLIRMHDKTGMSINELRVLMGVMTAVPAEV